MNIRRRKTAPTIPVSSMADIAFLLLIFFMVTSVLETEPDVPITLPDVPGGEQLNKKIANVYIAADKSILYNSVKMPLPEVINNIRVALNSTPDLKVLVHADKTLPYEEIDRLFELLKEAGALKVSLVTKTTQGGGLKGK